MALGLNPIDRTSLVISKYGLNPIDRTSLVISKYSNAVLVCPDCGTVMNPERQRRLVLHCDGWKCSGCGFLHYDSLGTLDVQVRRDNARYLDDTPRAWWHGTTLEKWGENTPENLYVHIGTRYAAKQIIRNCNKRFLFRVRLKDGVQYAPGFYHDENNWPTLTYNTPQYFTAYRYINRVESPGSVSVLVPFGALDVLDCDNWFS